MNDSYSNYFELSAISIARGPFFQEGPSSLLSPLGPGIPCDPLSPICPLVPSFPWGP